MESQLIIYIGLSVVVLLLVALIVQIIYIRMNLSRYSKEDYYKQLMVKNEYVSSQTQEACSNFQVYAWQLHPDLKITLNSQAVKEFARIEIRLPEALYSIYSNNGIQTVAYQTNEAFYVPLIKSLPSTIRFTSDIINRRVDYVVYNNVLYRVYEVSDFADRMRMYLESKGHANTLKALETTHVIALVQVPSIEIMKLYHPYLSYPVTNDVKSPLIKSFAANGIYDISTSNPINESIIHVIGYRVAH